MSLMLARDTRDGVDQLCGWVIDRYGVAWQVVSAGWFDIIGGPGTHGARRTTEAMLSTMKFDIAALQTARDGNGAPH